MTSTKQEKKTVNVLGYQNHAKSKAYPARPNAMIIPIPSAAPMGPDNCVDMTGAEIVTALEQGVGNWIDNDGSSGAYPYGAGIRWDIDISQPFGSRFTNVEVQPKGTTGWVPIDTTATYVVVANSFMAGGGDGYEILADVVADGRGVDTFLDYAQSWIDWLEAAGGPVGDPTDFSTQSYLPVPS